MGMQLFDVSGRCINFQKEPWLKFSPVFAIEI